MNNILKRIDRPTCSLIRTLLEDAVRKLESDYGVCITIGREKFDDASATFSLEVATCDQDGAVNTKSNMNFSACAGLFGLDAEDIGRSFESGMKRYVIVGVNPRSAKFPILARCEEDGKTYKFPVDQVRWMLGK